MFDLQYLPSENVQTEDDYTCIPFTGERISLSSTLLGLTSTHTHLLDRLHGWWRVLVAAQIDHDPGDIAEEGDGNGGADEREQRLDHTQADHIVSALRAIT